MDDHFQNSVNVDAYIAFGYPAAGTGSNENDIEYHYGTEEKYKAHSRRYSLKQVICHNSFESYAGDITSFKLNKKNNKLLTKIKSKVKSIF